MRKKIILLLGCILVILGVQLINAAIFSEKNKSYLSENSKVDKKVIENLEKSDKVRVIVKLKDEIQKNNFGILSNEKISKEEIKIRAKNLVKNKVRHDFIYSNAFSAELDSEEIKNLIDSGLVEEIYYDYPVHAFLQDSVPLINASISWNLQVNGINLTGAGQTICIIDTGVNYSHPDLGGCYGNNNASSSCKVIGGWDYVNNDSDPVDDDGHGTHVSGIAAANGSIKGVAPNSKIIMIKALDAGGGGYADDVIAGIEWCTNNASIFNISVISMSLGCNESSTGYSNFCDTENPVAGCNRKDFMDYINNAVAKNISVVVATGNDYWSNAISAPACIYNATRVTSSNKEDKNISLFANTWNDSSKIILAAPGENINSTIISGGYSGNTWSGTSMATPHVAGAIALINQYLSLTNRTKTPKQIESVLNNTGKLIYDQYSGINFSRINVYSSILSLDEYAPEVNLIYPENNTYTNQNNLTFKCNSSDLSLKNITFYLWNSTSLINQTSYEISGSFYELEINISNLNEDNYKWTCKSYDEAGNSFTANNFSFFLDTSSPQLAIISPTNITYNNKTILINISSDGSYIWFTNASGKNETYTTPVYRDWNEGSNIIYVYANDSAGNINQTSISFSIDTTPPTITIISPLNQTYKTNTINFNLSSNEALDICFYTIDDWQTNITMTALNSTYYYNITSLADGSYTAKFWCNDTSNNINDTEQVGFSISSIFPKVNLIYPENDTYTNQENQTFSCNATDNLGLSNITLYIWNSTSLIYENITLISGTYNETSWNYTFNYEGNFFWNCLAYNNESNSSWSEKGNYTLVYDTTPPTINLISPSDDYSTTSTSIIFYYNVSDASNIENCSLIINNAIDQTLTNITKDTTLNFTKSLSVGSYNWSISCVDSANNQGNSTTRSLTITSSEGGGGGGGGSESCSDECSSGAIEKSCVNSTTTKTKTCGNYDSDSCLEWSDYSYNSCSDNEECKDGSCVLKTCTEDWTCTEWSSCINNTQTRLCTDKNNCNTTINKPNEIQSCSCTENWQCTEWSSCINNTQTRFCEDINECGTTINKPIESTSCDYNCTENWVCNWTSCENETLQYPIDCIDTNNCGTSKNYPSIKSCGSKTDSKTSKCLENFECENWSECKADYSITEILQKTDRLEGTKVRTCVDINNCSKPVIQKASCSLTVPVKTETVEWCNETITEVYDKRTSDLISRIKVQEIENISKINVKFSLVNFTKYCDYCYDGVKNYDETGLDCGGENCPPCIERNIRKNYTMFILRLFLLLFLIISILILLLSSKFHEIRNKDKLIKQKNIILSKRLEQLLKEAYFYLKKNKINNAREKYEEIRKTYNEDLNSEFKKKFYKKGMGLYLILKEKISKIKELEKP